MNNSLSSPINYLPISEAAKFLGVSQDTLRRWDKSGVLQSKRLDGKNRYFSLQDLKKNRSDRPFSISEVSKKFNISATTLRRLEARGIIKPKRNKAGERVFESNEIERFAKSEYFQRKKYTPRKEKTLPKLPKKEVQLNQTPKEDILLDITEKPRPLFGNFIAISTASFVLLMTVGIGNVFLFKTQNYEMLPLPMVLGEKITEAPQPPLVPAIQDTEIEEQSSILTEEVQIEQPETALEKSLAEALKEINERKQNRQAYPQSNALRLVEIITSPSEIREAPHILSRIISTAQSGDIFEFLSFDSGWIQLRLHESTQSGFIQEQYTQVKEFEFSSQQSSWSNLSANESTDSAFTGNITTEEEKI